VTSKNEKLFLNGIWYGYVGRTHLSVGYVDRWQQTMFWILDFLKHFCIITSWP